MWQGKYSRPSELYPEKWNAMRWAIFTKYNYRCQLCGRYAKGNLVLHHKIPIKISHDNSPSNLQVLCVSCHKMVHSKWLERKQENW